MANFTTGRKRVSERERENIQCVDEEQSKEQRKKTVINVHFLILPKFSDKLSFGSSLMQKAEVGRLCKHTATQKYTQIGEEKKI